MKHKRILAALLACLMLAGCGEKAPETTSPPETSAPVESAPVETTPPTTEPTEPPTTEPELQLEPGVTVTADGDTLESGSVVYESVTYVKVGELLSALDGADCSGDDSSGWTVSWHGTEYQFLPENEGLVRNGSTTVLSSPILTWNEEIWMPVEEICQMWDISLLNDPQYNTIYCTSVAGMAGTWTWAEGIKIPVLMYHGVTDNTWGADELFVSPSDMEEQIRYLVENGYDTITFEDWSHLEDFDKPVMLTYDDGYLDNYEELFPILQKYNAKATIFVITTSVDKDARTMTSEQARQMSASGLVSIQSHTFNHPHLSECDEETLHNQMLWSKLHIARMTGYEPFVICYPYGDSSPLARDVAMEYYRFGLNMTGGLYTTGTDETQITRYYVARNTTLSQFIDMVDDAGK